LPPTGPPPFCQAPFSTPFPCFLFPPPPVCPDFESLPKHFVLSQSSPLDRLGPSGFVTSQSWPARFYFSPTHKTPFLFPRRERCARLRCQIFPDPVALSKQTALYAMVLIPHLANSGASPSLTDIPTRLDYVGPFDQSFALPRCFIRRPLLSSSSVVVFFNFPGRVSCGFRPNLPNDLGQSRHDRFRVIRFFSFLVVPRPGGRKFCSPILGRPFLGRFAFEFPFFSFFFQRGVFFLICHSVPMN